MNDERRAYDQRPQHDDHQHHPRPGGGRQYQQRGQDHSPARDGGRLRSPAPDVPPPSMVQKIGNTIYEVSFHFSTTSRETMSDKINRLIRRDLEAG